MTTPAKSEFYRLTPEEQAVRFKTLAEMALAAWDIGPVIALDLIKIRENAVFKVQTEESRYVLRIHRFGYHTDGALRSEFQWMAALDQSGIPTPHAIPTRQGKPFARTEVKAVPEPRQVGLFAWIDGVPISDVEDRGGDLAMHRTIGTLMARMHTHAAQWSLPEGFTRHAWDLDGLLGPKPVWGRFWELPHFSEKEQEKIQTARTAAKSQLADFGQDPDRYGLIHCDFLPENLLKDGDLVRVIDFDDCGFGWHLFDMVTSLFTYSFLPNFEEIKSAFIEGYRSQRNLPAEHLACFDLFMLLRVMTTCGWFHTRPETDEAREFGPGLARHLVEKVDAYLNRN
jgi:Ser/Thr protein kinase RdoA (MazF antagonist)